MNQNNPVNFSSVKAGDMVLVPVSIRYGFNSSLSYMVQRKVDRVTPTQFVVGDSKFYKADGRFVGDSWGRAYPVSVIGQKVGEWNPQVVVDDTARYETDVRKLKAVALIKKSLEQLGTLMSDTKKCLELDLEALETVSESVTQSVGVIEEKIKPS